MVLHKHTKFQSSHLNIKKIRPLPPLPLSTSSPIFSLPHPSKHLQSYFLSLYILPMPVPSYLVYFFCQEEDIICLITIFSKKFHKIGSPENFIFYNSKSISAFNFWDRDMRFVLFCSKFSCLQSYEEFLTNFYMCVKIYGNI